MVQGLSGGSGSTITGWTQAVSKIDSSASADVTILYKIALGSESTLVTAAGPGNTVMNIAIYEYTGFLGIPTLDKTASANATSTSIATGTTTTTTKANELLIAGGEMNSLVTLTSWSNSFNTRNTVSGASGGTLFSADQIVSATATYTTTATVSGATRNAGAIATFYDPLGANADLTNKFTYKNYSNAIGDDGDYFIEYGSEYMIRNYQRQNTNSTDIPTFTWRGRTTYDTRTSPMFIQIFNVNSSSWETLAVANKVPPDTDFSATVSPTGTIANYYDSNNFVTFRSYQQVI